VEDTFMRSQLRNCIFVGHVNTDLDSIAGAICAAELFGGVAARAEDKYNGEIEFALQYVGMDAPPMFDNVPGALPGCTEGLLRKVCLVDHNEVDQMTKVLKDDPRRMNRIAGLIDHHAIASSFTTSAPLFMDVRPWGSMSSIVFHMYLRSRVPIRREVALLLLCAILSDTLNLKSGTTTPADRFSVALLSAFAEVDDIFSLAMRLFEAKTNWIVGLGAYEMVRGDQKNFAHGGVRYSLAVLEVTSMDPVLAVAEDIITQLRVFKYERGDSTDPTTGERRHDPAAEIHCALLFVVDTIRRRSAALICGGRELHLARAAFPDATWRAAAPGMRSPSPFVPADETLCDLGIRVSRKLDFAPACADALARGAPG
jgi:manganese-dependent inorganic pyrophosphatase